MKREGLGEQVRENLLGEGAKRIGEETFLIVDINVEIKKSRRSLLSIVLSYMKGWQIEETIRFAKQSYTLEDIRLLSYRRLRTMMVLVRAGMYFAAVRLGSRLGLRRPIWERYYYIMPLRRQSDYLAFQTLDIMPLQMG